MDRVSLLNRFEYKDGELVWKTDRANGKVKAGSVAGYIDKGIKSGYKRVHINGRYELVHRIIFLLHHGYLPEVLDHIDGNKLNNRIENLRECTLSQNGQNQKTREANTTGFKNVYWHKQNQKWLVKLTVNKAVKYLGQFDDIELADLVAQEARNLYFGSFTRV